MKKQKLKNLLKLGILVFGISFLLINCDENNISEKSSQENIIEKHTENLPISITTTSLFNVDIKFNSLTNKYNIDKHKSLQPSTNTQSKTTTTNKSSIVVYTDIIKEITQGDYTSYTMLIKSLDDDPNTFYNLTIEEENGNTGMFVTQYRIVYNKASKNAASKQSSSSNMEISTRRINDLQEPVGPEDFGNENGGSSGGGSGGGSGSSSTYPTDCDGSVIITTVATSIPCGCGHSWEQLLNGTCTGCNLGYPTWPSLKTNTVYECVPSSGGGHNPGGGTNTGGGSSVPPSNGGNGSITTPVNPDGTSAVPDILTNHLSLSPAQTDLLIQLPDLANDIFNFLQENNSQESKEFAKKTIEILSLPIINSIDQIDYVAQILRLTNHLKQFGNIEDEIYADYIESLIPDFNSMTINEVRTIYSQVKTTCNQLTIKYAKAIITPIVTDLIIPVVTYALFEATAGTAIKLLQKIPVSIVLRGARLNKMVIKLAELGVPGTQSHVRIITTSSPISTSKELFLAITKNAESISLPSVEGTIVANMGNGNYITYRTVSGSGYMATINLNFPAIFGQTPKAIKFTTP